MAGNRFHLHARRFTGTLAAPIRNETQQAEGDDRPALEQLALHLSTSGWHVWLYERQDHGHAQTSLAVLREFRPSD